MKPVYPIQTLPLLPLVLLPTLLANGDAAFAQASNIVPDNTLGAESSQVIENFGGFPVEVITGGAQREQNLFHSFQEFNVSEGRDAYFNSPNADIQNIFSRVTGTNPSEILGTLGTFGESNPNLYLINPNGIIFGNNARLDVQGSFTATTADSIRFGTQGEYSAANPQLPQVLTVNPDAYFINQLNQAGAIINRSFSQDATGDFVGLQVPTGENLTFLGGEIIFDSGEASARGGNIYLGGLSEVGIVEIRDDGSLNFPELATRANVLLTNQADIDVRGTGGGNIEIRARNLTVEAGDFAPSLVRAGLISGFGSSDVVVGNTTIISETINLDSSFITNVVELEALGNGGDIRISSNSLSLTNGSQIFSNTDSQGLGGNIDIATNSISINGNAGGFFTNTFGSGNAGNLTINAQNLELSGNSQIASNSSGLGDAGDLKINSNDLNISKGFQLASNFRGEGNGGDIKVTIRERLEINGTDNLGLTGIITQSLSELTGNVGNINIGANQLILSGDATVSTSTFGQGNAGNLTINANQLSVQNGASINTNTLGSGDSGRLEINATEFIEVLGRNDDSTSASSIQANTASSGNGQESIINTGRLTIIDGATVVSSVAQNPEATGNAGNLTVNASETVEVVGFGILEGQDRPLFSLLSTQTEGIGNAGNLTINSPKLSIQNGGIIATQATDSSQGNAGNLTVNADLLELFGRPPSDDVTLLNANTSGQGNAGNLTINSQNVSIKDGADISAGTFGNGNSGDLTITAQDSISIEGFGSGIFAQANPNSEGNSGNLTIETTNLSLNNQGFISSSTFNQENAGDVEIQATSIILDSLAEIQSIATAEGNAGNIRLDVEQVLNVLDSSIRTSAEQSNGGEIQITAKNINLRGDGDIFTSVNSGIGSGGDIAIDANSIIAFDDSDIFTFAVGGQGGNINLITNSFFAESFTLNSLDANPNTLNDNNRADINATGVVNGVVDIPDVSFLQNALTELNNDAINTEQLVANSCVVPNRKQEGTFLITGRGGLATTPDDESVADFSTGDVQTIEERDTSYQWQSGNPIIEPSGVYLLSDGRLVMSRKCENM